MSLLLTGAAVAAGAIGSPVVARAAIRKLYATEDRAEEVHYARTRDGWEIALSRYLPHDGAPRGATRNFPVVIIPGLAANRFSVDLAPEASLPQFLSGFGFDCFVMEARGVGRSERPGWLGTRGFDWCLDHHVRQDVPAAVAEVLRLTGRERVHLVGHSMGGIISYAFLATGGAPRVQSVTVIGSSLDYSESPSDFHRVTHLVWLAHTLRAVPIGPVATLLAPLSARRASRLDELNIWPSNTEPALYRRLQAIAFHPVPGALLAQLATAFERGGGGLRTRDKSVRYLEELRDVDVPILAVAGTKDRQCPPDAAESTLLRAGRAHRELRTFGLAHGQPDEYGHFDLLMGKRAQTEVMPVIEAWLQTHD